MTESPEEAPVSVYATPAPYCRPGVGDVFVYAAAQIHQAAADMWPGAPVVLERHVPSVTGYVHQARVGDRTLYAKTSLLGLSLVSLLRGAAGSWPDVLRAQEEYLTRADGLLAREAAQIGVLAGLDGPRVCAVAGKHRGVIFTEPVTGSCLGELLLREPAGTRGLLAGLFAELRPLHRPSAARHLEAVGVIGERGISGTFLRKFNGLSGRVYVDRLGEERCTPAVREEVVTLARRSVRRLRRLRMTLPAAEGTTLAYGDLKPEHVMYPDGPGERPVLLDPGLQRASMAVDVAKLVSRIVLFLAVQRPGEETSGRVLEGLEVFAGDLVRLSRRERGRWLANVVTLWLMDTTNILSTYLSAPAALPLPGLGLELVERAVPVCSFLDTVSADVSSTADPAGVWGRALTHAAEVAS
ncbi:hypothetical protein [Streptomyces sp. NPDC059781]|uniref:hypothetical protein n=1 Tax=Streptomyces sp. NPDC059781 TaxID=3346943 RepID=UPI0036555A85